jgi:hypothetical protein
VDAIQWAIGVLVIIQTAVIGFIGSRLWAHVVECKGVGEKVAALDRDVERMKSDIGTHSTGLRGAVHEVSTMCTQHELRITMLERQ